MELRPLTGLTVIEVPYRNMRRVYYRREFDDYKLCGLYHKLNVPVCVVQAAYNHEDYPLPEGEFFDYDPEVFSRALGALSGSICQKTEQACKNGSCVLLTGGGCEHVVGVLGGLQKVYGTDKKIGFIWLDAHGDFNTPETSESGRPGGMPLAVAAGRCCEEWRKRAGLEVPIPTQHIILADGRNLDEAERKAIQACNMKVVNTAQFNNPNIWKKVVEQLAEEVDLIYLHMDLDVLDGKYLPNSLFVEEGGPEIETVMDNIRTVMRTGKVMGFSLVSVTFMNGKPGQDIRTLNGMRLLGAGLESWKLCPNL